MTKVCEAKLGWALVRDGGCVRYSLPLLPEVSEESAASTYLACVLFQEINWQIAVIIVESASGSRLAFDLGKSDSKTVAVKDDEVLYSCASS